MRWFKPKAPSPKVGDTRIVKGFLLFPKTLNNQTRWFETVMWEQVYETVKYQTEVFGEETDGKYHLYDMIEWWWESKRWVDVVPEGVTVLSAFWAPSDAVTDAKRLTASGVGITKATRRAAIVR